MALGNQYAYQNWNRTKWSVDIWDAVNLVWSNGASNIYAPNANMPEEYMSSQMKYNMSNGSLGYIIPEVPYKRQPITFQWLELLSTDAIIANVKSWVQAGTLLRINTADGQQWIGNFTNASRIWLTNDVSYDLQAVFERTTS